MAEKGERPMKNAVTFILLLLTLSVSLIFGSGDRPAETGTSAIADTLSGAQGDTVSGRTGTDSAALYRSLFRTALKDSRLSDEERRLMKSLENYLGLRSEDILELRQQVIEEMPEQLDQSGRWPLVLQNIAWGAGLYGWGIPYVLGVRDGQWIVGMELMSFSGGFYFTHRYTQNMDISHARAQMMRLGSGVGFLSGYSLAEIFGLWDQNSEKAGVAMLMAAVPAGILAGDRLYRTLEPSNGQAWSLSLWGSIAWYSMYQIHVAVNPDPQYPEDGDMYDVEDFDQKQDSWEKQQALVNLLAYPTGIWAAQRYFGDRSYSFGDALMLTEAAVIGGISGFLFSDLVGIPLDKGAARVLSAGGAIGTSVWMDSYIRGYDYSFGNAFLMGLGSSCGILFNLGVGAILELQSSEAMDLLFMSGAAGGFLLTRKIVEPDPEDSRDELLSDTSLRISPALLPVPGTRRSIPALAVEFLF